MTDRWTNKIDQITADFKKEFSGLTAEQLNWKPNEQTWNIAQNIEHLIAVNETYPTVIEVVKKGTYKVPFIGKFGFMVNFLGKMILGSVQPDRKRKMRTFPIWKPATGHISGDILNKFEEHQEALKRMIAESQGLLDKDTVISSPANKNIVYKLETAFDIIITHEQRHFEQAKEVLNVLKISALLTANEKR
jgi:hypothetical protein